MKIKKRLQINVAVSVMTAFVICLVLFLSLYRLNQANNLGKIAGDIIAGTLERVSLRNDYMRNNGARAKEQWFARQETISGLLKLALENFRDSEDRKNIVGLIEDHEASGKIFSAIVANREKSGLNSRSVVLSREVEDRLLSQLNMRVYEETMHGRKMLESARKARNSALRVAGGGVISALLILIAAAMINSWIMGRAIRDRVALLRKGAAVIGSGDLDHRIDVKGDDEFAEIAESFNSMTAKLRGSYRDLESEVIERKRAEEALRKAYDELEQRVEERTRDLKVANAYNRSLIEASLDPLVTIGHDGKITDVNTATEAATGLSRTELIGSDFSDYFSEQEKARAGYERVFEEGSLRDYALELTHRDGHVTSVLYNATVYSDEGGKVIGVFAAARDITEQKQAENALRVLNDSLEERVIERTAQLNSAIETLRTSRIAALNLMEDAVVARREAEETSDELLLEIEERKRAEEERQTSVEFLRLVNESRSSADLVRAATVFFHEKSGCEAVGLRLKEGDDYPYFEAHGFPEEFVRLENRLCEYNESNEIVRDSAGNPVIECMCGNVICGRFDPSKPFFTNNGSFWSNCTTELLASTTEADRQARTRNRCNGQGYESVALIPLSLGEERLGLLQLNDRQKGRFSPAAIALWERLSGYLSVALTKFKAEEALGIAKETAEAASRAKSQFLANMSHELRTPMTGVLGMLEFTLNTTLEAQQREFIETAHKSARTLLRILNDILDLAKVEAGKLSIETKPFVLGDCVAGAIDILLPEARHKELELNCTMADDLPNTVVGDQVRLLQVLTNLCGNAVKFTEKGKVEVKVTCGGETPEGKREITFIVTDTGIGIPDNKKELIFGSFNQADDSHARRFGGTGLGLAISRELVERMGGTISCVSAEGRGSTFSFTIPLEATLTESETVSMPVAPPPAASAPVSSSEKSKARLLLAEDDPITRQVIGLMLKHSNFDHDIAENGLRAVEMWEKGNYDLVLMDVQMPGQDGFAATGDIRERERERGGHTLIIAMTAHAFPEDEKRCLAAGMDAYIPKPIDLKKCIAMIEELIGKRQLEA
jgi:PAS domain S-box-containing protein